MTLPLPFYLVATTIYAFGDAAQAHLAIFRGSLEAGYCPQDSRLTWKEEILHQLEFPFCTSVFHSYKALHCAVTFL